MCGATHILGHLFDTFPQQIQDVAKKHYPNQSATADSNDINSVEQVIDIIFDSETQETQTDDTRKRSFFDIVQSTDCEISTVPNEQLEKVTRKREKKGTWGNGWLAIRIINDIILGAYGTKSSARHLFKMFLDQCKFIIY